MANFADIADGDELENKYTDKVIVYVEAEGDAKLFDKLIGPGHGERIEFKVPPVGGTGSGPAKARVRMERPTNKKVFALIDGEASLDAEDGFDAFLTCDTPTFVSVDPNLEGVIFLGEHEAENILLRRADICSYIAADETLAGMGKRDRAEVAAAVKEIVERYVSSAVCKYTSVRLHSADGMDIVLDSGIFWDDRSRTSVLRDLKAKVAEANCAWADFRGELKVLLRKIVARLNGLREELRFDERARLADGKSALKKIRHIFKVQPTWEGHLVSELAKSPYANDFREDLFIRTNA